MPQPTPGDVHVDAALTNILVAFTQDADTFIAGKVFPMVPVAKQSDKFFKYDKGDWNRAVARKRAPGTESAGSGWKITTDSYFADVFAVHKDVDEQTRSNADPAIDLDRDATRWVSQQLLIRKDKEWADNFFATSTWTGSTTGGDITPGTKWDASGGDPIKDIDDEIVALMKNTGKKANKLVLSMDTWIGIKNNADVIDRIKHTQRGIVTEDIFAALVGVEEVLILRAIETTSAEGATDVQAFIGSDARALLLYVTDSPSILEPTAGYHFGWTGLVGSGDGMRVKSFPLVQLESDRIEGEMAFDPKQISAEAGVFFVDTLT